MTQVFLTIDDTLLPRYGLKIFGTGMHRDAVLSSRSHTRAPESVPGSPGRPRKRGDRLPTSRQMLQGKNVRRIKLTLYDRSAYHMRVATQIGRFYKAPDRDVLVIAGEHLRGGRGMEVFYTTDLDADVESVLQRYSWRWSIEVTFHDCKGHLGIDEPQNRTTMAARRTAPTGFLLYSLIVWWHETTQQKPAKRVCQWTGKGGPSFADMLAALRTETLENTRTHHFETPDIPPGINKFLQYLEFLLALAA